MLKGWKEINKQHLTYPPTTIYQLNKNIMKNTQLQDSQFICPDCQKTFEKYECAKELNEGGEYYCQECWDKSA